MLSRADEKVERKKNKGRQVSRKKGMLEPGQTYCERRHEEKLKCMPSRQASNGGAHL